MAPLLTVALVFSPFAIVGCLKGRYAMSIVGLFVHRYPGNSNISDALTL